MKRVRRYILIACGMVIAVLVIAAFWLFNTSSGARFALKRALAATHGKLAVASIEGKLAGPLVLTGVHWRDVGVDAVIGSVALDLAPFALFSKTLHLINVEVSNVHIALTVQPSELEEPSEPFLLSPPFAMVLDRFHLTEATITHDGRPVFAADTLDLGASWTMAGLALRKLELRSPDGRVDLDGTVGIADGYPGQGKVAFDWHAQERRYVGMLDASSNAKTVQLNLALSEPVPATLALGLTQDARWPWTLALRVPRFDSKRIVADSTLGGIALELGGSGDKTGGTVTGAANFDTHRVLLDPLRFGYDGKMLHLEALTLRSPEAAGRFDVNGTVALDAVPPSAKLDIAWSGVELPADIAGQVLPTHGELAFDGSSENYAANGRLTIGPTDRSADIVLDIAGNAQAVTLKRLALKQPTGGLEANGEIMLKPAIGWKITATANKLDPGAFATQWGGAVDFSLASEGVLTDRGPQATLKLDRIGGTLRRRSLAGKVDLTVAPDFIVDGTASLRSGQSTLDFTGRGGKQTDAQVTFALASLADFMPDAEGRLRGDIAVRGAWPALAVDGRVNGAKLGFGEARAESLDAVLKLRDVSAPAGDFTLAMEKLSSGGLAFDKLVLNGGGDRNRYSLRVGAHGPALNVNLSLSGTTKDTAWNGTLESLTLATRSQPAWKLEKPVALALRGGAAELGELCLEAEGPRLCLAGKRAADGAIAARYRIERLPLAQIAVIAMPDAPLQLAGEIGGEGAVSLTALGAFSGTARLASAGGSMGYPDSTGDPLLKYSNLLIDAQLQPDRQRIVLDATLANGKLVGDISSSGAEHVLSGAIVLSLQDLGFVELLTTEVAQVKGKVDGRIVFGGTASEPRIGGALTLDGFATEVPGAGLKLYGGQMRISAENSRRFTIDGRIASGEGALALSGSGAVDLSEPVRIVIRGEKFLAADIAGARVVVSPNLEIVRDTNGANVTGEVMVPSANVDLAKLPGGGVAKTSPDVVVIDAAAKQAGKAVPISAEITVKLGDQVALKGFGLDGKLAGQLVVVDRPGKLTTGRGEIRVSGTYKAYGQDLKIQAGRLLFAGTEIYNPGLDLRAVRELKDVTAGLRVQGTAQVPVLTVYSEPAMEQSEALSYLVTGKSLSALKSGEGDIVQAATQALGSATGDLLAKSVGARLGVDAAVADSATLGGAAFTVGKYLSPKLYLSYGVGLFTPGEVITLRYRLSKRWNLEAQSATTQNRAGLNYRWER